jgi:PAS domain S-box-containing protein
MTLIQHSLLILVPAGLVGYYSIPIVLVCIYVAFKLIAKLLDLRSLPDLKAINQKLEREIIERTQAEAELQSLNHELENRVFSRTQELSIANQSLQLELIIRNQAEQALFDALQKLNSHVENSPLGVIEWDQNFQVTRWSTSAENLFGWSAEEVFCKTPIDWKFVFEDDLILVKAAMDDLARGTTNQLTLTNRNYRSDGAVICCEWYNSVLLDGDGKMESILSLVMDVTDRYRIEQMKSEFISVVSHELRTPLTAIHGSLRMLASGLLDPQSTQQKRLLAIASDSTDRLVRLINDILDIERIESGNIALIKKRCWIPDVLASTVAAVYSLSDQANVTIEVQPLEQWIDIDCDRIIQALTNLLANAIKFSESGQKIDLKVTQEDVWAVFRVCDRGRGIPSDKLDCIFERFQQVDSSDARNHEGTGLGLAISRSIIQQHFGKIWVQSTPGEGSVFSFTIPLRAEVLIAPKNSDPKNSESEVLIESLLPPIIKESLNPTGEEHQEERFQQPFITICEINKTLDETAHQLNHSTGETRLHKDMSLLLVEDDNDLAEVLITSLAHHDIKISRAATGLQAIKLAQETVPDLIILDLILPDRDGFAVVDWLQQHQKLKNSSLMVYSAKDLDVSDQQKLKLGHTDFITKSRVTPHEFEERVMSLLQGKARSTI